MSKTASVMVELGSIAPSFSLINVVDNTLVQLHKRAKSKATLIMFICNHCPYVKHLNPYLSEFANEYLKQNVDIIAINSNDVENYPQDSPENMLRTAQEHQYPFPYLFDESQEVARAYQAACTPDFYVYDEKMSLAYRGQFDDSRPGNAIAVTGDSIRAALDALLTGNPVNSVQKPSLGCNIKWKP